MDTVVPEVADVVHNHRCLLAIFLSFSIYWVGMQGERDVGNQAVVEHSRELDRQSQRRRFRIRSGSVVCSHRPQQGEQGEASPR